MWAGKPMTLQTTVSFGQVSPITGFGNGAVITVWYLVWTTAP